MLPASGFSDISKVSPFGTLASTKSELNPPAGFSSDISVAEPQTSSSAFAASGFAALSKSTTSPFGTLGATSNTPDASPFSSLGSSANHTILPSTTGSSNKASLDTNSVSGAGGFRSAAGSTFGTSATSAFGSLGGSRLGIGFGSGFGGVGAGGLKTFAAPNGPSVFGTGVSSSRAFGSPAVDDEEDEDGDEDGQPSGEARYGEAHDHEDKRFHEQDGKSELLISCFPNANYIYNSRNRRRRRSNVVLMQGEIVPLQWERMERTGHWYIQVECHRC